MLLITLLNGCFIYVDWYHDSSYDNLASFMTVYNPTGAEPVPREYHLHYSHIESTKLLLDRGGIDQ